MLELPTVVEEFAMNFDRLPQDEPGLEAIKVHVATGAIVVAFAVYGMLMGDGSVELVALDLDTL